MQVLVVQWTLRSTSVGKVVQRQCSTVGCLSVNLFSGNINITWVTNIHQGKNTRFTIGLAYIALCADVNLQWHTSHFLTSARVILAGLSDWTWQDAIGDQAVFDPCPGN